METKASWSKQIALQQAKHSEACTLQLLSTGACLEMGLLIHAASVRVTAAAVAVAVTVARASGAGVDV